MSQGIRVMLVEDHDGVRHSITSLLEAIGFTVTAVATATGALEALRDATFDVICTDLGLPDMDGAQLIGVIRDSGIDTPVVLLSGAPQTKISEALRGKPQPQTIIKKPTAFRELTEAIERLAQQHSRPATRVA